MRTRALVTAILILAALGAEAASALPRGTRVETYAGGLAFPIDMAWDEGTSRIFYTEKNSGKVRVMVDGRLLDRPCVDLPVNNDGERGAGGLALSPSFDRDRYLYVFYTNASPLENRVTRFTVQDNRCTNGRHIVTGLPAGDPHHHGAHLDVVGGKLFVTTGDLDRPSNSQDKQSRAGKVLRYNLDGTIPSGNPFGNAIWSIGLRNPYGLTHRPGTSQVFATDNGPECDDEVNRITKGANYGWGPNYRCGTAGVGSNPKAPLYRWRSAAAPTDAAWYTGSMSSLSGALFVGDYVYGRLHRFTFNADGTNVTGHQVVFDSSARIVDVSEGPGGWLYFMSPSTSSIYRIVPS
jgi:glucose/arabinose dehydrogenase